MRLSILFISGILLVACHQPASKSNDPYLFKVGDTAVLPEEFVYAYTKNNFNKDSVDIRKDINEYLELFIRFKLKVKEGRELGLDDTEAFKQELSGYQKQLAKPYLSEKSVTEELIKEAYDRMKSEIKASHILITVAENAEPTDSLKAYEKIQQIRDEIINGAEFSAQASKYSQDPSAKKNGGLLGYFSSFQMVYPFESAAYKTAKGQISQPVRTRFGYHIIKVHDRREARGRAKVAHIMVRSTEGISPDDSLKAFDKINELHTRVLKNEDWDVLCAQFSDDFNSKTKGGALPWFSSSQMIPSFANAAFALQNKGDVSTPVKTPYGWHIIRLDEKENLKPFEDEKAGIEKKVGRDSRGELSKKLFIKRLKKEHGLIENNQELEKCLSYSDSTLIKGQWKSPSADTSDGTLFELAETGYTNQDFYKYIVKNQKRKAASSPRSYMRSLYVNYLEATVMAVEESKLGEKYPEYRMLLNEYHEGIMLFELMDKKVWSKAVKDSTGLANYFNENIANYQWRRRANAVIYNAENQAIIDSIKVIMAANDSTSATKKSLEQRFNKNSPLTLQIDQGLFEIDGHKVLSQIKELSEGNYIINDGERINYVVIEGVMAPQAKSLSDVRGAVISEYQNFLEDEWVALLKGKYAVKKNTKELEKIINDLDRK